jgi:hypothetical protein
LEVERILAKLGKNPFELLKEDQEEGFIANAIVEKQVSALNESLINFFKQGISSSNGARFSRANIASICQICNLVNHIASIYLRIGNLKPKCGKCGLLHGTKNCGLRCGYYTNMGHIIDQC